MEWVVKLEARSGWGEVETIEVAKIWRRVVGLTGEEVGLTLAEGKDLLGELGRLVLQTQMEEYTTCARVCPGCMKLRRQRDCRTRKIQTIFGTITVEAPRISVCPCMNSWGFIDVSMSPLAELLPDRCTPEFRLLQAELSARRSYREAARLLTMLLPCEPPNHATMRNRTHQVAAEFEARTVLPPKPEAKSSKDADVLVLIDGAHIRAAPGYQTRHVDVTVGKIEVVGQAPRRFALAAKGAVSPLGAIRQALKDQGWQPGRSVTALSDGEAALPGLIRAAVGEPISFCGLWPSWQKRIAAALCFDYPLAMKYPHISTLPARPDLEPLMRRVESLGVSCELGIVQRHCGAQPLSLLRFAYTPLPGLIGALNSNFEGVGDPDRFDLNIRANHEWYLTHRQYGFEFHTEHTTNQISEREIRQKMSMHLTFLARTLLGHLAAGEKIFVYRPAAPGLPGEDAKALLRALRKFGQPVLLWVTVPQDSAKIGSAEWVVPGRLMVGYIDRFAELWSAYHASFEGWHRVVAAAVELERRRRNLVKLRGRAAGTQPVAP